MFHEPIKYIRKRLNTILTLKFLECEFSLDTPEEEAKFYLPIDSKYMQVINFALNANINVGDTLEIISVGNEESSLSTLGYSTILYYTDILGGQIFDDNLKAYGINTEYDRPEDIILKYMPKQDPIQDLKLGSFLYIKSTSQFDSLKVRLIYEDLDR